MFQAVCDRGADMLENQASSILLKLKISNFGIFMELNEVCLMTLAILK
jgi:hypothetical protein